MTSETQHFHVVGVAGVGMSALAELLLAQGARVSGSDRYIDQGEELDVLTRLDRAGVALVPQDGRALTRATTVAVSTAIEEDNADLIAAHALGARVIHRAALLAEWANPRTLVAVTGTSGKTTVTGMAGWILAEAGRDPTVVNGGAVLGWRSERSTGSVRVGRSDLWVVEADESDRSLLQFRPDWALVTNASRDHFALPEVLRLFRAFAHSASVGALCGPGLRAALELDEGAPAAAEIAPVTRDGSGAPVFEGEPVGLRLPGAHNLENAWAAMTLCHRLGVDRDTIARAIERFPGIHRRLEVVGRAGGVLVVDDYAHNPAKIDAAWRAIAEKAERVLAVWRPHGFGPLAAMADALIDVLQGVVRSGDRFFLLPVYYAGGTANRTLTASSFAARARHAGLPVEHIEDYEGLQARLVAEARPGDAVLCMGARDPALPRFVRQLAAALAKADNSA